MGAERWLRFKNEQEEQKFRRYFFHQGESVQHGNNAIFLDWESDEDGSSYLQVGYSFGSDYGSEMAAMFCREVCKRFHVVQFGADSVGWYDDDIWGDGKAGSAGLDKRHPRKRYGDFDSWIDWIKAWQVDWSSNLDLFENGREECEELDRAVEAVFFGLDTLEASEQDELDRQEIAREAGMLHGVDAYNEAMGYDTSPPEPCGHHCPSDCPRCGDTT